MPDYDDTIGIFKGYCMMGSDTALAVETAGGGLRYIPVAQIASVDLLERCGEAEPAGRGKGQYPSYG